MAGNIHEFAMPGGSSSGIGAIFEDSLYDLIG
jgi:hypothetical protein